MTKTLINLLFIVFLFLSIASCKKEHITQIINISDDLQIQKLDDHSYIHISQITLQNGKQFACNGFVYINNAEAYVFDTPANDKATLALIDWLQKEQKVVIKGVIFNHFHADCTEGMDVFKNNNIPCIASRKTAAFMQKEGYDSPDDVFENMLKLKLGNKTIINTYFGEAHTKDNIVSYFPDDKILYGGCMIKSLNAQKGNLADANIEEWANTVTNIKNEYPDVEIIIPGHGNYGGPELLDYTITLFSE